MMMHHRRWLIWLLLVGLVLRLIYNLGLDASLLFTANSGDGLWYLANGLGLVRGDITGRVYGIAYDTSVLPTAPLYLVFVGLFQRLIPDPVTAVVAIRIAQAFIDMGTCYMAWRLSLALTHDARPGLVTVAVLAFAPNTLPESSAIRTEVLYNFWVMTSLMMVTSWLVVRQAEARAWDALATGAALGLAGLTRAVFLAYPLALAGVIVLVAGRAHWRRGLRLALVMLVAYGLVMSIWTLYNAVHGRLVVASDQLDAAIWRGAIATDGTPAENDALLGDETYGDQAVAIITADPLAYIGNRIREWTQAVLTPFSEFNYAPDSIRIIFGRWVADGFSLDGLGRMLTADRFLPRVLGYLVYYSGIVLGLAGAWSLRQRWRHLLPAGGFIAYTWAVHSLLLALPRYIFPTLFVWWVLAGIGIIALLARWQAARQARPDMPSPKNHDGFFAPHIK